MAIARVTTDLSTCGVHIVSFTFHQSGVYHPYVNQAYSYLMSPNPPARVILA